MKSIIFCTKLKMNGITFINNRMRLILKYVFSKRSEIGVLHGTSCKVLQDFIYKCSLNFRLITKNMRWAKKTNMSVVFRIYSYQMGYQFCMLMYCPLGISIKYYGRTLSWFITIPKHHSKSVTFFCHYLYKNIHLTFWNNNILWLNFFPFNLN